MAFYFPEKCISLSQVHFIPLLSAILVIFKSNIVYDDIIHIIMEIDDCFVSGEFCHFVLLSTIAILSIGKFANITFSWWCSPWIARFLIYYFKNSSTIIFN